MLLNSFSFGGAGPDVITHESKFNESFKKKFHLFKFAQFRRSAFHVRWIWSQNQSGMTSFRSYNKQKCRDNRIIVFVKFLLLFLFFGSRANVEKSFKQRPMVSFLFIIGVNERHPFIFFVSFMLFPLIYNITYSARIMEKYNPHQAKRHWELRRFDMNSL